MDQEFMDEIDDGFELEEYRDSVYVRLAKTEQCNRELDAENRRLEVEVVALKTGDLSEAYAAGEQKIIGLLAASNGRVKKLKEELADVLRCYGENAKAWIESVEQGAINRTQLLAEIGLGEQRIKELESELQTAKESSEDSELLDKLDSLGDIGMIAIDDDLEGMNVKIVWNKFGIPDVPANVRDAIRAVKGIE